MLGGEGGREVPQKMSRRERRSYMLDMDPIIVIRGSCEMMVYDTLMR